MDSARFRSKHNVHNYLKDLSDWGYFGTHFPSDHPARGFNSKLPKIRDN